MICLLPDMDVNKFVDVKLPTKKQIFGRIGATAPGSHYSGDNSVDFGLHPTEQAYNLVTSAEKYEPQQDDSSEGDLPE